MMWALLFTLGQVGAVQPEDLFPPRLDSGVEKRDVASKSSGPRLATANIVVQNSVDISTWAKFIDYFAEIGGIKNLATPGSGTCYNILRNGLSNQTSALDRASFMPNGTRWLAFADGSVGFEFWNAFNLDPGTTYGSGLGGYANALAVDTGIPYHNKDSDGNETGINTSEYGKRFRCFRWLRYTRTVDGVEKFEWWQLWMVQAHVSGAAGAYEEYTDKVGVVGIAPSGLFGPGVVAKVGSTAQFAPQYWVYIANPAPYVSGTGYQTMTCSLTFQAYYGSSTTLSGVDRDLLLYLKEGFNKHLSSFFTLYGAGKDFYWEHCRSVQESQLYWWQAAGSLGYGGGTLPVDYLADVVNGFKAGFGSSGAVPITWSVLQAYKGMSAGERAYYVGHVGSRDWDGDGWSNAFERKHGYSFQNFFDKPGDYDLDGWLDSLDVDTDGDGEPNDTDTDDDADGVSDYDEYVSGAAPYKWLDQQLRERPQFYDVIKSSGRVGPGTAETNEKAKGVYTYDDWLVELYDENKTYLFRWDDVQPGATDGPSNTWEPDLVPYYNQDQNERVPSTSAAAGETQSTSPETIDPNAAPYRAKEPNSTQGYGPGYQEAEGGGFDGWGVDEGDWYAPPHKLLDYQGTGLEELGAAPEDVLIEDGTVVASDVENAFFGFLDALGVMDWVASAQPAEGATSDYGGYVTFYIPGSGNVSFPIFMLPDPNSPMGQRIETAREYIRTFFIVVFIAVWFFEMMALWMPEIRKA